MSVECEFNHHSSMFASHYKIMDPNFIAIEFLCPVCNTLPINGAVLAEDGFFYDRGCIEKYFSGHYATSPMTGEQMSTLIVSSIVDETVKKLVECEGLEPTLIKTPIDASTVVEGNGCDEMDVLAKAILFKQGSIYSDESHFYQLTRSSAEQGNLTAKFYEGLCVIRGIGVESNWAEGFELLVDVASKEECGAKNLAAYTLGVCYERGVCGFKKNDGRARKWFARVNSVPQFVSDYWEGYHASQEEEMQDGVLLFDEIYSSTASTMTSLTAELTMTSLT